MRKTVSCLVLTLCVNVLGVANAAYVIKLKNGNEYVTNRYWQEGTQVLFDAEGGVFGIDKMFVNKIEKTDNVIRLVTVAPQEPGGKPQTDASKESRDKEAANQEAKKKERDPNDPILGELNRLKDRAKDVDSLLTVEIRDLLKEITAFRTKLIKDRALFLEYPQEVNDISNLSNVVEASLRSRTN